MIQLGINLNLRHFPKNLRLLISYALLSLLTTGCIGAFVFKKQLAPQVSGKVLDSQNFQPIENARVTRYTLATEKTDLAVTDRRGIFIFEPDFELRPSLTAIGRYDPPDVECTIYAEGYQSFTTNMNWNVMKNDGKIHIETFLSRFPPRASDTVNDDANR